MTWIPLLLADSSACLRLLVLRELLHRDEDKDAEIKELQKIREKDPLVSGLLELQAADGSWGKQAITGNAPGGAIQTTAQALTRLGYLGFGPGHPAVKQGAEYLFSRQQEDGAWPLAQYSVDEVRGSQYDVISLQTSFPLRGLAACGYAVDPRAEKAYDWLLAQRLEDGAWPSAWVAPTTHDAKKLYSEQKESSQKDKDFVQSSKVRTGGNYGFVAGYRKMPRSRWGCRSNTTAALTCLSLHPRRRQSPEAKRALDLLLGRESKERHNVGFEVARTIGAEPAAGFFTFFARFDPAQLLDLCWRIGVSIDDERATALVDHIKNLQGPYGLWEYVSKPQAGRWVTFDLLRSLSGLRSDTGWISTEPRTPFTAYPKPRKRY